MPDFGPLYHFALGAGLTVLILKYGLPALVFTFLLFGLWRETEQHDLKLTPWQLLEGVSWAAGSALVVVTL